MTQTEAGNVFLYFSVPPCILQSSLQKELSPDSCHPSSLVSELIHMDSVYTDVQLAADPPSAAQPCSAALQLPQPVAEPPSNLQALETVCSVLSYSAVSDSL